MIKILEKDISDKIAAGEVVDRPLSIVKELVENSIDAGADAIAVEIKKGGKTYIRVTDNGCGIQNDQVTLAFERHATSKIISDKDLESIETLGFRGEALASIAAVSRVELITKTKEEKTGSKTIIRGSQLMESSTCGCPDGTTIVVADLFYNTPARQKFMKSDAAESSLIIDFISQVALAYPWIKIRIINNSSILFSTNGRSDRQNNILTIYGREAYDGLVPVFAQQDYMAVEGYVSSPKNSRTSRRNQIIFVNGRVVSNKIVDKAISEAYSDRLFEGRFPVVFLFLKVSSDKIDVNIHPNKREVRFDQEEKVKDFVTLAIKNALAAKEAIPEIKKGDIFKLKRVEQTPAPHVDGVQPQQEQVVRPQQEQVDIKKILSTYRAESEAIEQPEPKTENYGITEKIETAKTETAGVREEAVPYNPHVYIQAPAVMPFDFSQLTVTGAVFGTYITAFDEDSFYFIDQHAAHERIFYEKILNQYMNEEKLMQPIMLPFTVDVPYAVKTTQEAWLKIIQGMGFDIDEFGPKTYIVKAIPMFMELSEAKDFVECFIDSGGDGAAISSQKLEKIAQKACKSAVKANDILSHEEMIQLICDLAKCKNPFSCPHGRPSFIKMSRYEIEKMFKRV